MQYCNITRHTRHFCMLGVVPDCLRRHGWGGQEPFLIDAFGDADGTGGADEAAEVAADALVSDDTGLTGLRVEGDGLVPAVHAGDVAASAADALVAVGLRIDDGFVISYFIVNQLFRWINNELSVSVSVVSVSFLRVCILLLFYIDY